MRLAVHGEVVGGVTSGRGICSATLTSPLRIAHITTFSVILRLRQRLITRGICGAVASWLGILGGGVRSMRVRTSWQLLKKVFYCRYYSGKSRETRSYRCVHGTELIAWLHRGVGRKEVRTGRLGGEHRLCARLRRGYRAGVAVRARKSSVRQRVAALPQGGCWRLVTHLIERCCLCAQTTPVTHHRPMNAAASKSFLILYFL